MKITYYGHSCFTIESGGYVIAVDPYDGSVPGYKKLSIEANGLYCSHGHFDHNYAQAVTIVDPKAEDPFTVTEIEIPHDHEGGSKRGMNIIRIFEAEGKKVIHFGDIGCMPSAEDIERLKGADAALVPVGGFFTIDAAEAKELMDKIEPVRIVPMHYRKGLVGIPMIADIKKFLKLYEPGDKRLVVPEYKGSFEI